ncbi:MAG: hypothetical protein GY944_27885 [bacterium]|nr:hypothetical protein [bacterium]
MSDLTTPDLSPSYPPAHHILSDLRIFVETGGLEVRAGLEVVPEMACEGSGVRAGVIAVLVDIAAGTYATRAVAPGWTATCDMVLHTLRRVDSGTLIAVPRPLRRGKSTVVVEVEVREESSPDELVALATVTFSILESRSAVQRADVSPDPVRSEFGQPDSGLSRPVLDALGVEVVDAAAGEVELAMSPYVGNTLSALQGGALAILVDAAAEAAGCHAAAANWITKDLVIHYLALGKVGPIRTRARVLENSPHGTRLRIEVNDCGSDQRLLSVATVEVGPPHGAAGDSR